METAPYFLKPTPMERVMNKAVGVLARLGLGPAYIHLLQVQGRRTGTLYSTPVNLLKYQGRSYLVGGRGHTAWSRNAAAVKSVTLRRGRRVRRYAVHPIDGDRKLEVLQAYLEEYRSTVQRFFEVPAGSPVEDFRRVADRHPVFEAIPQL